VVEELVAEELLETVSNNRTVVVRADDKCRVYGEDNPALTYTVIAPEGVDLPGLKVHCYTKANASSPVGVHEIELKLTGSDELPTEVYREYDLVPESGKLCVTKAPLVVVAESVTLPYGNALPAPLTATVSANQDGITATASLSLPASTPTPTPVGAYAIIPNLAGPNTKLGNYAVTPQNGTLTVTPAPLVVVAESVTVPYGDALPAPLAATVSANQDGITATASLSLPASTPTPTPVGAYAIIPNLAGPNTKLGNYAVAPQNGTLTVTRVALSDDRATSLVRQALTSLELASNQNSAQGHALSEAHAKLSQVNDRLRHAVAVGHAEASGTHGGREIRIDLSDAPPAAETHVRVVSQTGELQAVHEPDSSGMVSHFVTPEENPIIETWSYGILVERWSPGHTH
jgi:hypothetical protein